MECITRLLNEDPRKKAADHEFLKKNEVASLLTVAHSLCLLERLPPSYVTPKYLAGYSIGQYTALYVTGVWELEVLFDIIFHRAMFMNRCIESIKSGMMAVIGLKTDIVEEVCLKLRDRGLSIYISNYNCVGQLTLAGERDALLMAKDELKQYQPRKVQDIPTEGAWHCPLLKEAGHNLKSYLENVKWKDDSLSPVVSNNVGGVLDLQCDKLILSLVEQVYTPVQWSNNIKELISFGVTKFIEVGYQSTLTKFGFFIDRSVDHLHLSQI